MSRVVIIAGGEMQDLSWHKQFLRDDDIIICADHGLDHARALDVVPDLIVGDFDSSDNANLSFYQAKGITCLKYPEDKDLTDTQIALEEAKKMSPDEIVFFAVLGDRLDHSLSNVFLLTSLMDSGIKARIVNERCEAILVDKRGYLLQGKMGDVVSLLAITPFVYGITTTGLEYPLHDADLTITNPYAVSNVLLEKEAKIWLKEGLILLVHSFASNSILKKGRI